MKCKLKDIAEINPRLSLKKGQLAKKIAMDQLRPFCRDIPGYTVEPFSGGAKFCNGDTIMARITPCLENGKTAKVTILDEGEVGFGSTEYIVFRAKDGISDEDYLYYLICSPVVRDAAIKSMVGSSGRQRVQTTVVENIEIDLPAIERQKRIGALLRALDDKIELNNKINANLEQQAQALFRAWFVDFEPFGGKMPEDWRSISLSAIADFVSGYSYKGGELQPSTTAMVTIKNFDRVGGFKLDGFKELMPSNKIKRCHYTEMFDTVVAHTDLTQKAEVIGNAETILNLSGYKSIVFSMDLVKVVPKAGGISKFLLAALLKDPRFKAHCLAYVSGTTVLHLSKKALPDYMLSFPKNWEVLAPLDTALTAFYTKMATLVDENCRLRVLRDTLLPKLMSGEIDVSDVSFPKL